MNQTRRTHFEAIPPVPAILAGIVSVQLGAALAKGLTEKDEGGIMKFLLASREEKPWGRLQLCAWA